MDAFLEQAGWKDAKRAPITPDWSPRQYWRVTKPGGETAILLKGSSENVPGHSLRDFVQIAIHLRKLGLSAPEIYEVYDEQEMALIEDFGDTPIDTPAIETQGYETAVDVLSVFRKDDIDLTFYKDGYIFKKLGLFSSDPGWMAAWQETEARMGGGCPHVFAHMDYKAGNLHWLGDRADVKRIGLLDFQAAQCAPFTYDIVNLLEDARRELDPDFKAHLKKRFKDALPRTWRPFFDDWYVVMAAQFHARVLGQIRDNTRVAPDIAPRLRAYLRTELDFPCLAPVAAWCEERGLRFD